MTSHKFKPGDRVVIRKATLDGREFVEGHATVVRLIADQDDHYIVRFNHEPGAYERYTVEAA